MNTKLVIPKGYKNLQDFLLHYRKEEKPTHTTINNTPRQKFNKKIKPPSDNIDDFKVQIVMSNVPDESPEILHFSERNFYERAQKSNINPKFLADPSQLSFTSLSIC